MSGNAGRIAGTTKPKFATAQLRGDLLLLVADLRDCVRKRIAAEKLPQLVDVEHSLVKARVERRRREEADAIKALIQALEAEAWG